MLVADNNKSSVRYKKRTDVYDFIKYIELLSDISHMF